MDTTLLLECLQSLQALSGHVYSKNNCDGSRPEQDIIPSFKQKGAAHTHVPKYLADLISKLQVGLHS